MNISRSLLTLTFALALTTSGFAQLASSKSSIVFNNTFIGNTSGASDTILNTGSTALTFVLPFTITGPDALDFHAGLGTLPTTLAGHSSGTPTLSFTPSFVGTETATLTISSSAGSVILNLSGTGVPEPSTYGLLIGGFAFLVLCRSRTRQARS